MTTNDTATADPKNTFLTAAEVFERYRWKRSRGYQVLASTGFPRRVGNGYRLDTLQAWEEEQLTQTAVRVPNPEPMGELVELPARKRARRAA